MKPELKAFCVRSTADGGIRFKSDYHQRLWKHYLKSNAGKDIWIELDTRVPNRTERQNRFYWLYLGIIAQETGEDDPDYLHERFKAEFLNFGAKAVFGKLTNKVKGTAELTKLEFGEYLEKINRLTGVPIPDPSLHDYELAPLK